MNKIEELIQQLCPNGVEYKELGEVCTTINSPIKLKKENYFQSGKIPIIDQGIEFIAGYSDVNDFVEKGEYIIFGDHSEHIKYVDFAFVQGADGLKILKPSTEINAKYVYYSFVKFYNKEGNYKRHWSTAKTTLIPIPPLEIQKEIVKILDDFTKYVTELTSELTSELTFRKQQYSYYRDKLLSFEDSDVKVEWKTLGEVAKLKNGGDWKSIPKGKIPVYGSGGEMGEFVERFSYNKPTVLIPRKGSISNLFYLETPFWNVDTIYYTEIDSSQVMPKYLYYFLLTQDLDSMATNPTRPSLTQSIIDKIKLPVPPLHIQEKIVEVLDNFDKVCNDLNIGLPKEIEQRQQQYEYYRDLLLTFDVNSDNTHTHTRDLTIDAIKLLQYVYGVVKVTLGEIGMVSMCKRILKNQTSENEVIPFYKIGTFGKQANSYISNELFEEYRDKYSYPNKGDVLISASGTIGRTVVFNGEPSYFQDSNIVWLAHDETLVLNKYLYYFYATNPWKISDGGTIGRLYNSDIQKTIIPLPPLAEQQRIVDVLDKFDTLVHSLSEGLPKEIEQRQQQYEYYRDKLLDFETYTL
ncbi:restriction endonuclease subunit S [Aerococcaceae bacterium NML191219]|nr:restriction endonuclease subunit S [Aerococcaceae bacterium NML191219]